MDLNPLEHLYILYHNPDMVPWFFLGLMTLVSWGYWRFRQNRRLRELFRTSHDPGTLIKQISNLVNSDNRAAARRLLLRMAFEDDMSDYSLAALGYKLVNEPKDPKKLYSDFRTDLSAPLPSSRGYIETILAIIMFVSSIIVWLGADYDYVIFVDLSVGALGLTLVYTYIRVLVFPRIINRRLSAAQEMYNILTN